jgi:hypothetical protein
MKPGKVRYTGYRVVNDGGLNAALIAAKRAVTNAQGKQTNAVFATQNPEFLAACEAGEIPATPRQASKYRRKMGRAWDAHLTLANRAATATQAA